MMKTSTSQGPSVKSLRHRLYNLLEPGRHSSAADLIVDRLIVGLICINVAAVILESFDALGTRFADVFRTIEIISVAIFTVEYLARAIVSPLKYPTKSHGAALAAHLISAMALIDLAAILPFYLPFIVTVDLRFLRILRLTRLLRVLKISRYARALSTIGEVLKMKAGQLIVTLFVTSLLLLLSASAMYYLETDTQPEAFPNIIAAFWWAVATLTTVGYGDVYPVTVMGKILAGLTALLGVGFVALPTGIISAGYLELIEEKGEDVRLRKHSGGSSLRTKARQQYYARSQHRTRR